MNIYDFYCCHTILQIQKNTEGVSKLSYSKKITKP